VPRIYNDTSVIEEEVPMTLDKGTSAKAMLIDSINKIIEEL
jgi:hypothetical protein